MPSHIIKRTQKRTTSIWDFEHKDFAYEFFYKLALVEYMGYPVSMYVPCSNSEPLNSSKNKFTKTLMIKGVS